jgi:hypothetical protein
MGQAANIYVVVLLILITVVVAARIVHFVP